MKIDIINNKAEIILRPNECAMLGCDLSDIFGYCFSVYHSDMGPYSNPEYIEDVLNEKMDFYADKIEALSDLIFIQIIGQILQKDLEDATAIQNIQFPIDYNGNPYMEMIFECIEMEDGSNPFDVISSGTFYADIKKVCSAQGSGLTPQQLTPQQISSAIQPAQQPQRPAVSNKNREKEKVEHVVNQLFRCMGFTDEDIEQLRAASEMEEIEDQEDEPEDTPDDSYYIFEVKFKDSDSLLKAGMTIGKLFPEDLENSLFTDMFGNYCLRIRTPEAQCDLGNRLCFALNDFSDIIMPQYNQNAMIAEKNAIIKGHAMQDMYKQLSKPVSRRTKHTNHKVKDNVKPISKNIP